MKKDEYDEAIRKASEAKPTWQRMPKGHRSVETSNPLADAKDKLKSLGTQTSHIKNKNYRK